jgi:hypothetical protein
VAPVDLITHLANDLIPPLPKSSIDRAKHGLSFAIISFLKTRLNGGTLDRVFNGASTEGKRYPIMGKNGEWPEKESQL